MLDVFFTVDVELWCDSWENLDENFLQVFQRYVYGHTHDGEYGLRHALKTPQEHDHEVQLHLHTEWVDEAREPLLAQINGKKQFLRDFSLTEQTTLITASLKLIEKADGGNPNAFRAGSFGANEDTLRALAANRPLFDSNYNASMLGFGSSFMPGQILVKPIACGGVHEYPMPVFNDCIGTLRHAQLSACSHKRCRVCYGKRWNLGKNHS